VHVSEKPNRIKRILIVRTDRLGDVVLTLPMLSILRTCYPDAHIAMLLRKYTGEIIEGNPYVNDLLWYDTEDGLIPFAKMTRRIREKQFDAAIVVYPTFRLAWLMFRSGIPLRIGTGYRYYSFLFNKRVFEHRKDAKRHEVEYNLRLLNKLGCTASGEPEFYIDIPGETDLSVRRLVASLGIDLNRRICIVHPGSGGSAREWSPESFGKFAALLSTEQDFQIIITGVAGEETKVNRAIVASESRGIPLVGRLSVKELAAIIRLADLFVSNSTGPLHIASAVGTPVVGLYPPHTAMSHRRWGPCTSKKRVLVPATPIDCNECVRQDVECSCMANITVDQVYAAAIALLAEHATSQGGGITIG
jgi:heptosyltransferase III